MAISVYQIDTAIKLTGVFVDASSGATADPTTITLFVRPPSGPVQTYTGVQLTRERTGVYSMVTVPNIQGKWSYQWQGAGAVVATSPETFFTIDKSSLITS